MKNWIDIKDFEGLYQISNLGEVRSIRNGKNNILKNGLSPKGYYQVNLCKNNYCKNYLLHRLLAIHFIHNPLNKTQVNHIDGNKRNNSLSNLEWVTPSENTQHAFNTGLKKPIFGMKPQSTKLTIEKVMEIRQSNNMTQTEISLKYGVCRAQIQRILKGEQWTNF